MGTPARGIEVETVGEQAVVGSKVLRRGEAVQGAVGPIVVVEMLEAVDQWVELGERFGQVVDRVELVAPAAVGALDRPVELGRLARQDEQRELLGLAGGSKPATNSEPPST